MPDNGFGSKANSRDFLIRAYTSGPHFKTARRRIGQRPGRRLHLVPRSRPPVGFPIVNEAPSSRLLTGADIDPESLQRGRNGDLWVGDEFGPWILHFDARGRLLDAAVRGPGGIKSPNNPFLGGPPPPSPTAAASRPWGSARTASTCTPPSKAPRSPRPARSRRYVYEFSVGRRAFTGRVLHYRTRGTGQPASRHVGDLEGRRLVVIERDAGSGADRAVPKGLPGGSSAHRRRRLPGQDRSSWTSPRSPIPTSCPCLPCTPATSGWATRSGSRASPSRRSTSSADDRILVGCDNNLPELRSQPGAARRQRVHPASPSPAFGLRAEGSDLAARLISPGGRGRCGSPSRRAGSGLGRRASPGSGRCGS